MENFPKWFKVMYFYSIAIISAYSFIKLSIGFFLLRLADRTRWRPFLIGMLGQYAYLLRTQFRLHCTLSSECRAAQHQMADALPLCNRGLSGNIKPPTSNRSVSLR